MTYVPELPVRVPGAAVCPLIKEISPEEAICRRGYPIDETCWKASENHCWYYLWLQELNDAKES